MELSAAEPGTLLAFGKVHETSVELGWDLRLSGTVLFDDAGHTVVLLRLLLMLLLLEEWLLSWIVSLLVLLLSPRAKELMLMIGFIVLLLGWLFLLLRLLLSGLVGRVVR